MSSEKGTITKKQIKEALDLAEEINKNCGDHKKTTNNKINLFEAARLSELNHSRILATLFRVQNERGEYIVWNSFRKKLETKGISIPASNVNLNVDTEKRWGEENQIDIAVWKEGDFYVIIENKVLGAKDQDKQLERYIDAVKSRFDLDSEEKIYIVYLTDTDGKSPSDDSWGEYKQEDFEGRYHSLSYYNVIIPWFEDCLQIKELTGKLQGGKASLKLYKEYLNKTIRNNMATPTISDEEYNNLKGSDEQKNITLLEQYETILEAQNKLKAFAWRYWEETLNNEYPQYGKFQGGTDSKTKESFIQLPLTIKGKKCQLRLVRDYTYPSLYYGIKVKDGMFSEIEEALEKDFESYSEFKQAPNWYIWKDTTASKALDELRTLLENLKVAGLIKENTLPQSSNP